jgi:hypothetical protein
MASKSVAHYEADIEQNKTDEKCLDYIHRKYTTVVHDWLKFEPNPVDAWNLHFVSSKYPRGDDLTIDQFTELTQVNATEHFWNSQDRGRLIGLCWHKNSVTDYTQDAKNILIEVDPPSEKWLHRANWYKHHAVERNQIHLLVHDPAYNPAMSQYHAQFNNPVYVNERPFSFIRQNIVNCPFKKQFKNPDNFRHIPNLEIIRLSDLLNEQTFVLAVDQIVKRFSLDPIDTEFLQSAHRYYLSCNQFKYTNER